MVFAVGLMCLPAWRVLKLGRRVWRRVRGRLLGALLLLSAGAQAQGVPSGAATVQNYDTTTVSWTLPAGMSHKTARQAVATLTKMGTTLDKSRLTPADSAFLYKWMPGVLEPPKRRRPK
jgi:hypothetical protein